MYFKKANILLISGTIEQNPDFAFIFKGISLSTYGETKKNPPPPGSFFFLLVRKPYLYYSLAILSCYPNRTLLQIPFQGAVSEEITFIEFFLLDCKGRISIVNTSYR